MRTQNISMYCKLEVNSKKRTLDIEIVVFKNKNSKVSALKSQQAHLYSPSYLDMCKHFQLNRYLSPKIFSDNCYLTTTVLKGFAIINNSCILLDDTLSTLMRRHLQTNVMITTFPASSSSCSSFLLCTDDYLSEVHRFKKKNWRDVAHVDI